MGRGRAPCCAKIGLNKGSWTPEEDMRLIAYIQKYGHGNWRALPKQAGLLRCGKSCRLRWINYLRPDIKRGNFTQEEEETIIKLHDLLGNKWSKIASCLPGRTDNEIKNVWNTHLKKRLASKDHNIKKSKQKDAMSPSSSSTSTSCSDQGGMKCDGDDHLNPKSDPMNPTLEKFEIPIEHNTDILGMLADPISSQPEDTDTRNIRSTIHIGSTSLSVSSCSSSSNSFETNSDTSNEAREALHYIEMEEDEKDPLKISEIPIEPEFWTMIEDEHARLYSQEMVPMEEFGSKGNPATSEGNESNSCEVNGWLEYLEKELGLGGGSEENQESLVGSWTSEMEGDPVSSYFQKEPSPPSPYCDVYDLKVPLS